MTSDDTAPASAWQRILNREPLKISQYQQLARELQADDDFRDLPRLRLGWLGSASWEFGRPFVTVEGARRGVRIDPEYGPFGQLEQVLGDPEAALRQHGVDALVMVLRPEDLHPDLPFRGRDELGATAATVLDQLVDRLAECVRLFRQWSDAPVVVGNFAVPAVVPFGVFDANLADSLAFQYAQANERLRRRLAESPHAFVWDLAGLVTGSGRDRWVDPRLWAMARVPVAAPHQPTLAAHVVRTVLATLRPPAKCLVVDLDNTLWGGVIGDDGLAGIHLGDEYPGAAYKSFQRAILGLVDRGILVAVASKNEPGAVDQAFREHPEMLLRQEHLAAVHLGWGPKSESLRHIADELNIGIDALVFFDDNPVERTEVRVNAPEVRVVEVPRDPLQYVAALWESGHFDQPTVSREDRLRTDLYRQERQRRAEAERFASVEDFLASLEMVATVGKADDHTLQRIAQLIAKTNQFNLTTRRHSAATLTAMAADADTYVAWLRLRDRYGDQGLVAVAIVLFEGATATVDTFLMSCRVMGRQVERAFMAYLVDRARDRGATTLRGDYLPTPKNRPVEDFYRDLGFHQVETLPEGGVRYVLVLDTDDVSWPTVIHRQGDAAP